MSLDDRAREAVAAVHRAVEDAELRTDLPGTATRRTPHRAAGFLAAAAVLLAVALVGDLLVADGTTSTTARRMASAPLPGRGSTTAPAPATVSAPAFRLASALRPFDDCEQLVADAEAQALPLVTPFGLAVAEGGVSRLGGDGAVTPVDTGTRALPGAADPAAAAPPLASGAPAPAPGSAGTQTSDVVGTNVQEAGVDEPDLVKTDGELVVAVARGELQVVDVTGGGPRLRASLPLTGVGPRLFLAGDRVLVIAANSGGTALTLVDLADPSAPDVLSTMQLDGTSVDARLQGDVARLVLHTLPDAVPVASPAVLGAAAEQLALQANRDAVRGSTAETWLPDYSIDGAAPTPLVECGDVARPERPSGLGALSVVTLDLGEGLEPVDTVGVMTGGEAVYASAAGLYVATTDATQRTTLHKFDIADPGRTTYLASGQVRGTLLNRWSLSEHDGVLRVATTEGTVSYVSTLGERDGDLVLLGQVGDLGRGEQIYAVRFVGDQGYVVTFRRTDPLFVVDLSDPASPRLTGELQVPGYSAYLHPLSDGLLLGVGQDGTAEGQLLGTAVSLFDVSDPAAPRRLQVRTYPSTQSEVELDPHAFLAVPERSLVVVPLTSYGEGSSAVGLTVEPEGIDEAVRIEHPARALVRRSVVVVGTLYTLSDEGLEATDLDDLTESAFVPFS